MSNEFGFLDGYGFAETEHQRERAVRAALILLNTAISATDENYEAIKELSTCDQVSKMADEIQKALSNE